MVNKASINSSGCSAFLVVIVIVRFQGSMPIIRSYVCVVASDSVCSHIGDQQYQLTLESLRGLSLRILMSG
jgi:hypothetical protein